MHVGWEDVAKALPGPRPASSFCRRMYEVTTLLPSAVRPNLTNFGMTPQVAVEHESSSGALLSGVPRHTVSRQRVAGVVSPQQWHVGLTPCLGIALAR